MIQRDDINPLDYMLPLSKLPYVPFKTAKGAKEYSDYLLDLKIRLYQHGATTPEKWVIVALRYGTSEPIYIGKEIGRQIAEEMRSGGAGGDFITCKTSLSDIDNMIRRVNDNMKIR